MTWVAPESRDKGHYEKKREEDRHGVGGDMKTQTETASQTMSTASRSQRA